MLRLCMVFVVAAASVAMAAEGPAQQAAVPQPAAPVAIYTKDNAPPAPKRADLPLKASVSHFGVTWTFEKPVPCGQFVNGDWYVVGPATVVATDPKPIAEGNDMVRNGFLVNPPGQFNRSAFDNRMPHMAWFRPGMIQRLPITLQPGDSMLSAVSKDNLGRSGLPIKSYAVLTCLKEPVPADAFRPGYSDRQQRIYLARDLRRGRLPNLAMSDKPQDVPTSSWFPPTFEQARESFSRPWNHMACLEDAEAEYQFGGYGRAICQAFANATMLLCMDCKPEGKEPLLQDLVQHGLDLWGFCGEANFPGWPTLGGWGSGRKWPIVFAGVMLGDEKMASPDKTHPQLHFQEDNQTRYDDCWTGAGVVYTGHVGWFTREPQKRELGWGAFENVHPTRWPGWIGTSYRTNMTSSTWIGQALAIRILQAEKEWNNPAFFDYCDRWMYEPDPGYRNPENFSTQGHGYDLFAEAMWKKYREHLPEIAGCPNAPRPTDGWRKKRELKGPAATIGKKGELLVVGKAMFPIMVFAEHPCRIDEAAAIGANVIAEGIFEKPENVPRFWMLNVHDPKLVGLPSSKSYETKYGVTWTEETNNQQFLDALAAKGMYGIFGADARAIGHPALLGWIHVDEADAVSAKADAVIAVKGFEKARNELEKFSPASFVMRHARGDGPNNKPVTPDLVGMPDDLLLVKPAYDWMKKMDSARPVFLTVGETFFQWAADGKKDLCESYLKNCDAVGCKVPPAKVGACVAKLRELAGPSRMVYAWIETGAPQAALPTPAAKPATTRLSTTKAASPTLSASPVASASPAPAAPVEEAAPAVKPQEIRAAVIAAVRNGATGIGYRGFEGLDTRVRPTPEVLAELKEINEKITSHAAELLADPSKAESLLK